VRFVPFEMERWQSTYEHRVRHNLSESGVHPFTVQQLLDLAGAPATRLLDVPLGYSQSNGSDELRRHIAALYPGASPDQILVTAGSSEANFVACWRLIEPGDPVAVLMPAYMQGHGLAANFGAQVRTFFLDGAAGWEPHAGDIHEAVTAGTKLVIVTNPNNPTGHVLSDAARATIVERAREVGAWVLADEVYRGAERGRVTTPTLWGSYEKVVAIGGLSKAYGLPGLRIGWVVAPPEFTAATWARRDYTTICPTAASDHLATLALAPHVRDRILARTRDILHHNYPVLDRWLGEFGTAFAWDAPDAGAICWVRYSGTPNGYEVVEELRARHSVLLVPGEHFGVPGYLRFGYGGEPRALADALQAAGRGLKQLLGD
jgi:aspartate/methionine/tyrosine aminotransferase